MHAFPNARISSHRALFFSVGHICTVGLRLQGRTIRERSFGPQGVLISNVSPNVLCVIWGPEFYRRLYHWQCSLGVAKAPKRKRYWWDLGRIIYTAGDEMPVSGSPTKARFTPLEQSILTGVTAPGDHSLIIAKRLDSFLQLMFYYYPNNILSEGMVPKLKDTNPPKGNRVQHEEFSSWINPLKIFYFMLICELIFGLE